MRLGGLFLLLILSYFFNPIQPIVEEVHIRDLTESEVHSPILLEELDASLIDQKALELAV